MNYQTRRDLAYKRNMQEWLDLYVKLERELDALASRWSHIDAITSTAAVEAAYGAEADALATAHAPFHAQCSRELGGDMRQRIRVQARELIAIQDQERATMSTPEEQEHAELEPTHAPTCDCDECEQAADALHDRASRTHGHLREQLRAAAKVFALALALIMPGHASARELPLVPTDGECAITRTFEDGSATALCGHDVWVYDADGGYIVDNGLRFYYRAPGTWYTR